MEHDPRQTLGDEAGGLDWQAIHEEFRPKVEQAATTEAARDVTREMLARLHQTHFAIFPSSLYQALDSDAGGDGRPGFEARVLAGHVIVTEGPAVQPGKEIAAVNGVSLQPTLDKLLADASVHELQLERVVAARLGGPIGEKKKYTVTSGGATTAIDLTLRPPRGELSGFGNLPPQPVWFESKMMGNTGYIRFNLSSISRG